MWVNKQFLWSSNLTHISELNRSKNQFSDYSSFELWMNLKEELTPACTNMSSTISGPFEFPGTDKNNQHGEIAWQIEPEHCLHYFTTLTFFKWLTPEYLGFLYPKAPSWVFVPWGMLATDSYENNVALPCASAALSTEMCAIPPLLTFPSANKPPLCTWWVENGGDGEGNMKEEQFVAYSEKFPSRLGPLDHLSRKSGADIWRCQSMWSALQVESEVLLMPWEPAWGGKLVQCIAPQVPV